MKINAVNNINHNLIKRTTHPQTDAEKRLCSNNIEFRGKQKMKSYSIFMAMVSGLFASIITNPISLAIIMKCFCIGASLGALIGFSAKDDDDNRLA